jgi:glyoxylase-like metal-dependent hydrolase (beta-lactamase superfamily II)
VQGIDTSYDCCARFKKEMPSIRGHCEIKFETGDTTMFKHDKDHQHKGGLLVIGLVLAGLMIAALTTGFGKAQAQSLKQNSGVGEHAYPNMPSIAPIGVKIDKYMEVPASARGLAIDPAKGYRLKDLKGGLYLITNNAYQSMFLVYENGVVVIDAPPDYAAQIPKAIADVAGNKPITHIIYSHSHIDHIAGTKSLGGHPTIIAHAETLRLLQRAADPNRPLPTVTFNDKYTLRVGSKVLELSYHGSGHEPGNIFISAPAQRVLMVVDVVFPGWMPFRRFAVAQDVAGHLKQVEEIRKMDWDTLVGGMLRVSVLTRMSKFKLNSMKT